MGRRPGDERGEVRKPTSEGRVRGRGPCSGENNNNKKTSRRGRNQRHEEDTKRQKGRRGNRPCKLGVFSKIVMCETTGKNGSLSQCSEGVKRSRKRRGMVVKSRDASRDGRRVITILERCCRRSVQGILMEDIQ